MEQRQGLNINITPQHRNSTRGHKNRTRGQGKGTDRYPPLITHHSTLSPTTSLRHSPLSMVNPRRRSVLLATTTSLLSRDVLVALRASNCHRRSSLNVRTVVRA